MNKAKESQERPCATTRSRNVFRTCAQTFPLPEPIKIIQRLASWPQHPFVGHQDADGIQDNRSPTRKAGTRKEHTTATCHLLEIGSQRCSELSEDSRIGHLS